MLTSAVVAKLLGQSVIDEEQLVTMSSDPHEEVVRLDIPMDEVLVVDKFNATNHLVGQHEHRFHSESSGAKVEEVFERGPQQVHDENVVVALRSVPADVGDPDAPLKDLVQLRFVKQLRVASLDGLQLDSHLLAVGNVDAEVDVAERAGADLAHQPVLAADDEFGPAGHRCARHFQKRLRQSRS